MIYLSIYFLGASAYGVCNNNILAILSNNIGKLCTIALKSVNKRLTTKEKELQEDKKMKKKQKSDLQRAKKIEKIVNLMTKRTTTKVAVTAIAKQKIQMIRKHILNLHNCLSHLNHLMRRKKLR